MPGRSDIKVCQWTSQAEALAAFAQFAGKTQSASHIKPLHWYVACRLVLEGGFDPDDVTPRPPFRCERRPGRAPVLHYAPELAGGGERTVLGGLKTKNVDVVVTRNGIGPVLAVSCKGVTGAFRNLTNRMEETIGECTNLHITYPALVLGYLVLLRANQMAEQVLDDAATIAESSEILPETKILGANDIAIAEGGDPVAGIVRFHNALREMAGRRGIRNDVSRYEAIGFGLVEMQGVNKNGLLNSFPLPDSPLNLGGFFNTLYARYDERFVVSAPDLSSVTRRLEWDAESPALKLPALDFPTRQSN
ncbi:hypothetical protein ANOBCDAF_03982 [Pleomorphomonas sp. T1.2MG-36]|uniref:hypothetical protein n=1 Tax=Pleomorphomonas sp. T1.2MG-36 TaxID=3041167 RepID=UPI0024776721|nr:hypothetical protein [Pleomorphomonas sp. T1.2MG-36]CAI9417447.1 hypothetical protein ANOBCDAF_03982 [Pleomorphomonas sp. T1.2MG-36]